MLYTRRRRPKHQASWLRAAACGVKKSLFYEIFSQTDYFVLKFTIRVNFVKIVPCSSEHGDLWRDGESIGLLAMLEEPTDDDGWSL
jgi:hypothetical protein